MHVYTCGDEAVDAIFIIHQNVSLIGQGITADFPWLYGMFDLAGLEGSLGAA